MTKLPDTPIKVGDVFGSITIIEDRIYMRTDNNSVMVKGRCECGVEKTFRLFHLRSGHTKTCGCGKKLYKSTHGLRDDTAYSVWSALRKKDKKGEVRIIPEWRESFTEFLKGVGPRPSKLHRLKLIEKRFGYRPENCEWKLVEVKAKVQQISAE